MAITINFDFKVNVVQPFLTRGLQSSSKQHINLTGEFKFTKPKPIETQNGVFLEVEPVRDLTSQEKVEQLKARLGSAFEQLDIFAKIIDKRCKDIIVSYDPSKKSEEGISGSCEKIYGSASGKITYPMYAKAIEMLHKLDQFLAHRTVQNEGALDGI